MADVRPFSRAPLRPGARRSRARHRSAVRRDLARRSRRRCTTAVPHNIIRIEYGEQRPSDTPRTTATPAPPLISRAWQRAGVLRRDAMPALYAYQPARSSGKATRTRAHHVFALVRLEEWDEGRRQAARAHALRAQSRIASNCSARRARRSARSTASIAMRRRRPIDAPAGDTSYDFEADGQRHVCRRDHRCRRDSPRSSSAFADATSTSPTAITATRRRSRIATSAARARHRWTGDEPENFVLMALTDAADPGLLVLPDAPPRAPPAAPDDLDAQSSATSTSMTSPARTTSDALAALAATPARDDGLRRDRPRRRSRVTRSRCAIAPASKPSCQRTSPPPGSGST